jgi:hypothetical protein
MKELIEIINQVTKYGLSPKVEVENKEKNLEKNLIKLYSKYFEIDYEFDENQNDDFDIKAMFPDVIDNVKSNFIDFGWYNTVRNPENIYNPENTIGDAIDDLSDIIYDLLEIKWRKENNSENDAWWFFELIFNTHTQQHLLDLLNYMKKRKVKHS